jgi:hypothetical protein
MNTKVYLLVLLSFICLCSVPLMAQESFVVLPGELSLHGPLDRQPLLVQRTVDGRERESVREKCELVIEDPAIAVVTDFQLVPVADGETRLSVTYAGSTTIVAVRVSGMQQTPEFNFRNDVLPVFSKIGCNSGSCHGALAGKGGFRLSLRAYSADADYHTIVEEAKGRRVELSDPARSLILTKPTVALPHKGGLKFETDSIEYKIISDWIARGAKRPSENDPQVVKVELFPREVLLTAGSKQNFIVQAHFSGGEVRDVTRWSRFTSTNDPVAQVADDGTVDVVGHGGAAITAWYSSKIAVAQITAPYANELNPQIFADAPRRNFIDELALERLQKLNLPPAHRCTDEAFVRRAYLDTIGLLPTVAEVKAFMNDPAIDKRDKLIDSLLSRPEFVDYWSYQWSDVLLINGTRLRPQAVKAFYQWVRAQVEANTPWDEFVRQIIVSQGSSIENGATNFYALHQDPENMAENASQAFLGLSIACAKCHNHPLEKWTNDQYYGFANLFSRVRAKGWGGDGRNGDGRRTVYLVNSGELIQPLTGKPQFPTPLDGEALQFDYPGDRREHLANWLVAPDNPYFSRSITNRIWARYFGVGLVEQADDMRLSNPASNEALLNAAAEYLVENKFDLRSLMRAILQSETYQRDSQPIAGSEEDKRFYSHYYPRRLMAEVLLDSISQVTNVPTDFNQISFPGADSEKTDFYPHGTRALQLYDSAVSSYFLKAFGRNDRDITCECQRSNEPSMVQVLHLSNGDTLNNKLSKPGNALTDLMTSHLLGATPPIEDMIDQAFLMTLARNPTADEKQKMVAMFDQQKDVPQRLILEDLFWSLMTSREFLFNH